MESVAEDLALLCMPGAKPAEALRRAAVELKRQISAGARDPGAASLAAPLLSFLRRTAEFPETLKLAAAVFARVLLVSNADPAAALLALLDPAAPDPLPPLSALCVVRAALAEIASWNDDQSSLLLDRIVDHTQLRLDHPVLRTIVLNNLDTYVKSFPVLSFERYSALLHDLVWTPSDHDGHSPNRALVRQCIASLVSALRNANENVAKDMLANYIVRSLGRNGDPRRIGVWAVILPLLGSRGLVEAARRSTIDIPENSTEDQVIAPLVAFLVRTALGERVASARASDAAEALFAQLWKDLGDTSGIDSVGVQPGDSTAVSMSPDTIDRWVSLWLPAVIDVLPSSAETPGADHILTMLDERILRHGVAMGPMAAAAIIRALPDGERGLICRLLCLKRLGDSDAAQIPEINIREVVRRASSHASLAVRIQASAVLAHLPKTLDGLITEFLRTNSFDTDILEADVFWKNLARWATSNKKVVERAVPDLQAFAKDLLSTPTADPRRRTAALRLLGMVGCPPDVSLVPRLLHVVSRDLMEVNRTMACDLLVGFESDQGGEGLFHSIRPELDVDRWFNYARFLLSHRRALERLRGAMLVRTLAFYLASKRQTEPVSRVQSATALECLFGTVGDLADQAAQTLREADITPERTDPRLHGLLLSIQLIVSDPRSPLGSRRHRGGPAVGQGRAGIPMPLHIVDTLVDLVLNALRKSLAFFGSASYVVGETEFEGEGDGDDAEDEEDQQVNDAPNAATGQGAGYGALGGGNGQQGGLSFQSAVRNTRLISTNVWWRTVRAASALAALCVENLVQLQREVIDKAADSRITALISALMDGLLTIRHWGAAATLEQAFGKICTVTWRLSPDYHPCIYEAMDSAIARLNAGGVERLDHRYAGISRILMGVIRGAEKSKVVVDHCRAGLWKVATTGGSDKVDAQLNALNALIWIFKDATIGPLFSLEDGFLLALDAMSSGNVLLGRVATSLFAHALIPRAFGDAALHKHNLRSAESFFLTNSLLLDSVIRIAENAAQQKDFARTDLLPALVLLSRLKPATAEEIDLEVHGRSLGALSNHVQTILLTATIMRVREMAAAALWGIVPEPARVPRIRELVASVMDTQDAIHGVLFTLDYLAAKVGFLDSNAVTLLLDRIDWTLASPWNVAMGLRLARRAKSTLPASLKAHTTLRKIGPGADLVLEEVVLGLEPSVIAATFKTAAGRGDWISCLAILKSSDLSQMTSAQISELARECTALVVARQALAYVLVPALEFLADERWSHAPETLPSPNALFALLGNDPKDTDLQLPLVIRLLATVKSRLTPEQRSILDSTIEMSARAEEVDLREAAVDALRIGGFDDMLPTLCCLLFDSDGVVRESAARTAATVVGVPPTNSTNTLFALASQAAVAKSATQIERMFSMDYAPLEFVSDDDWTVTPDLEGRLRIVEAAFIAAYDAGMRSTPDGVTPTKGPEKRSTASTYPLSDYTGAVRYVYEYRRRLKDALVDVEVGKRKAEEALQSIRRDMDVLVWS